MLRLARVIGSVVLVGALAAGCGDDDDDNDAGGAVETTSAAGDDAGGGGDTTIDGEATVSSGAGDANAELCAIATEIANAQGFPTAEQLTRYQELAPPEITPEVDALVANMLPVIDDPVALFNVLADDESDAQDAAISAFEESTCGIPQDDAALPEGATAEVEPGAVRVDVTAVEFTFELAGPVAAGRTSFVVTNEGAQAHYLGVAQLAEGATIDDVLAADDPTGVIAAEWDTGLAAAGGDEEVVTLDLEPGEYAMLCFLPDADGTPHAFQGMAVPFTVG
jgi:hypothetical protein